MRPGLKSEELQSILAYVQSFHCLEDSQGNGRARSRRFLELVGIPASGFANPTVKITGTNGKGTTALLVEGALRAWGVETICLTSPHVYTVRERIRVGGRPVSWSDLGAQVALLAPVLEVMRGSEFHPRPTDVWTWISFALRGMRSKEPYGIFEVGKGGRRDVTNVFGPGVVGLTNIGSDHLDEFGGTRYSLLAEKLGLCTEGDILCYGRLEERLEDLLLTYCLSHSVKALRASIPESHLDRSGVLESEGLENLAVASGLVEALGCGGKVAMSDNLGLPGRFEKRDVVGRRFILDGAHNAEAILYLRRRLGVNIQKKRVVIFGAQIQKQWSILIELLAGLRGLTMFACVESTTGHPVSAGSLKRCAEANGIGACAFPGMLSALQYVMDMEWEECIVTGSFKLFRDFQLALHALGYEDHAVPIDEIDPAQPWMRVLR